MSEDTPNMQLPVIQNRAPESMVIAQKQTSLSRLFRIKPKTLELVAKSTTKDGAIPGTFRVTSTNENFTSLRAVIMVEPQEQRRGIQDAGSSAGRARTCGPADQSFSPYWRNSLPDGGRCGPLRPRRCVPSGGAGGWPH